MWKQKCWRECPGGDRDDIAGVGAESLAVFETTCFAGTPHPGTDPPPQLFRARRVVPMTMRNQHHHRFGRLDRCREPAQMALEARTRVDDRHPPFADDVTAGAAKGERARIGGRKRADLRAAGVL